MKSITLYIISLLLSISIISTAHAQDAQENQFGKYGISFGLQRISLTAFKYDCIVVRGNYNFSENISTEVEVIRSIGSSALTGISDTDLTGLGAFVKFQIPLSDNGFAPYIRAGLARTKISITVADDGFKFSKTDSGLAFGVGTEFNIDDNSRIRFEWTRYDFIDNDDSDPTEADISKPTGFALSFAHKF